MRRSSNAAAVAALSTTGLLAGALFYGLTAVNPTFAALPLDVHLAFRVELFSRNGVVMQVLMGASFAAAGWLALASGGRRRTAAAVAVALDAATFLVTRFGAVPINGEIREWQAGALAPDYAQRLQVWGVFNDIRVVTALAAFAVLTAAIAVPVREPAPATR